MSTLVFGPPPSKAPRVDPRSRLSFADELDEEERVRPRKAPVAAAAPPPKPATVPPPAVEPAPLPAPLDACGQFRYDNLKSIPNDVETVLKSRMTTTPRVHYAQWTTEDDAHFKVAVQATNEPYEACHAAAAGIAPSFKDAWIAPGMNGYASRRVEPPNPAARALPVAVPDTPYVMRTEPWDMNLEEFIVRARARGVLNASLTSTVDMALVALFQRLDAAYASGTYDRQFGDTHLANILLRNVGTPRVEATLTDFEPSRLVACAGAQCSARSTARDFYGQLSSKVHPLGARDLFPQFKAYALP